MNLFNLHAFFLKFGIYIYIHTLYFNIPNPTSVFAYMHNNTDDILVTATFPSCNNKHETCLNPKKLLDELFRLNIYAKHLKNKTKLNLIKIVRAFMVKFLQKLILNFNIVSPIGNFLVKNLILPLNKIYYIIY